MSSYSPAECRNLGMQWAYTNPETAGLITDSSAHWKSTGHATRLALDDAKSLFGITQSDDQDEFLSGICEQSIINLDSR